VFLLCRSLGCLPRGGGLYDQDWGFIQRASIFLEMESYFENLEIRKTKRKSKKKR